MNHRNKDKEHTMSIRCGSCKGRHETVTDVKSCYSGFTTATKADDEVFTIVTPAPAIKDKWTKGTQITQDGIYLMDGQVFKVQKAVHGSGHLYAKLLDTATKKFVYAPGMVGKLRAEHKMTLEQAKEYGALYGICCNCCATLTNEVSIEAGIGPVCAKKF